MEEVTKCFVGLVNYFVSKLESGEIFLSDIVGLRQCVYGIKDGDSKPKLYMVDVDPSFLGNVGDERNDKFNISIYLRGLSSMFDLPFVKFDPDVFKVLSSLLNFYNNNPDKFIGITDDSRSWLESLREKV